MRITAKRNNKAAYWLTMFLLTALVCDGLVGLYLSFFEKPHQLEIVKGLIGSGPVAHPYKSYINRPGTRYWNKDPNSIFRLERNTFDYGVLGAGTIVNEFGHQVLPSDIELTHRPKHEREFRILFLGGSTTFQPWPHLTADLLNRRTGQRNRFVAINAGTGGYTSQENAIDLLISGLSYDPDMVILYLPVNDIYWAAYYPSFKRDYTHMRIPLRVVPQTNMAEPVFSLSPYPFTLKLIDWVNYNIKTRKYRGSIDVKSYTTTGTIENGTLAMSSPNFNQTIDAVIENIRSMEALCNKRNIKFMLLTQKIFATSNPFYTFMDPYVLMAVDSIVVSPELSGVTMIEMQKEFPDDWSEVLVNQVRDDFPDTELRFDQGMAYDSMHFTPAALHLFAGIVAKHIERDYLLSDQNSD